MTNTLQSHSISQFFLSVPPQYRHIIAHPMVEPKRLTIEHDICHTQDHGMLFPLAREQLVEHPAMVRREGIDIPEDLADEPSKTVTVHKRGLVGPEGVDEDLWRR
jgi:hypothetical protein